MFLFRTTFRMSDLETLLHTKRGTSL